MKIKKDEKWSFYFFLNTQVKLTTNITYLIKTISSGHILEFTCLVGDKNMV